MSTVTIKDIALRANVSHTTVSRALNDSPLLSDSTKIRIRKIAAEMKYVPNLSAKRLVRDHSYSIGVFFSSMIEATSSDFVISIIKSINESTPEGYTVIYNGLDKLSSGYVFSTSNYDGIILASQKESDNSFIQSVVSCGIPIVVINREITNIDVPCIYCEERDGVKEAVLFLFDQGHRRIAYIKGNSDSASTGRRYAGFLEGLAFCGLSNESQIIESGDYSAESGYICMNRILSRSQIPTAVVCASDAIAFGAKRAISEHKLSVPNDISLVGFDDGILAPYFCPPLTSIGRPIDKMAQEAVSLLLNIINGKEDYPKKTVFPSRLSIKESISLVK